MSLLNEFNEFFDEYQVIWNSCDAHKMNAVLAPDLYVRWTYPGNRVSNWGYTEACEGWRQAYKSYEGHNPKWHFEKLTTTQFGSNEVLAAYWVRFEQDGQTVTA